MSVARDLFRLTSQLDLLRDAKRVVDRDAEVADCAFELRMTQKKLNRPQIALFL
jgi:hypothetical protein